MQVRVAVDPSEWQQIADRCAHATFFHTPLWTQVFTRTFPGSGDATRRFVFPSGRTAVVPLLEQRRLAGLCRVRLSTGGGCYGGWISADPLDASESQAIVAWLLRHGGNLVWRVNPFQEDAAPAAAQADAPDTTEVLDLRAFADSEELFRHYRHSARKQVNKGSRAGFQIREAESWAEWERYYSIYEALLRHWGDAATSEYPLEFFRLLHSAQSPAVKLWLVRQEDRVLGGNLNFYHGHHCVEWHAAYDRESFGSGVRDFTVHQIVSHARSAGYHFYDFNPSGGHEGARRFKQTFGTTSLACPLIVKRRGIYRLQGLRGLQKRLRGRARTGSA